MSANNVVPFPAAKGKAMSESKYTIVSDLAAGAAGAVTFWRMGASISRDALNAALDASLVAAGIDPATVARPKSLRTKAIVTRAIHALEDGSAGIYVDGASDGERVLCRRIFNERGLPYPVYILAATHDGGSMVIRHLDAPDAAQWEERARAAFVEARDMLGRADVSAWLTDVLEAQQAVSLRDTGGIYYVPELHRGKWNAIDAALRACNHGHRIFEIPAVESARAVEAVMAALEDEATAAMAKLQAEITSDDTGARALRNREDVLSILKEKIATYEKAFGVKAEALANNVSRLRANLTTAIVYRAAVDEGRPMDAPRFLDLSDDGVGIDSVEASAEAVNVDRFHGLVEDLERDDDEGPARTVALD